MRRALASPCRTSAVRPVSPAAWLLALAMLRRRQADGSVKSSIRARAFVRFAKGTSVAFGELHVRPEFGGGVVDGAVHVRGRGIFDMANTQVVPELMHHERPIF